MTEEEKKRMEELEAENKRLKEELEKERREGKKDDPGKNGEYNDAASKAMMARLEEMENRLKQERLDRFCDAIKDKVPAGIMDKAKALAAELAEGKEVSFSDNTTGDALQALQEILSLWPTVEERQAYSFSDNGDKDKNSKNDGWSKVASRL